MTPEADGATAAMVVKIVEEDSADFGFLCFFFLFFFRLKTRSATADDAVEMMARVRKN